MKRTTGALASVLLAWVVLAGPAGAATKRVGNREFVGFMQYANPFFIQGYVGIAPSANQRPDRNASVTLFVQRIRGNTVSTLGPSPVVCNQSNPEGEAAMAVRCGFSIALAGNSNATSGANAALRAGDRLRVKIAGVSGNGAVSFGENRRDTILFDFPIGQAEKFLEGAQGNGKGEAPGNNYFQGRIQQIRADSIRGYAVDDLFLAGRPANNVNIFNPTSVRVRIWQQTGSSRGWTFWHQVDNINADRTTETPLVQTSPGAVSNNGTGGTWPFGWVANLPTEKRLDNVTGASKYYIRLEEARWRGGGTPIDARVVEFAGKNDVPVIRLYDFVRDGGQPAEVQLQGDIGAARNRRIVERLETRALLEREEFMRRTPPAAEGDAGSLKAAPERLYGFPGDTDHGQRGFLPPPTLLPQGSADAGSTSNTPVVLDRQGRAAAPDANARAGEDPSAGGFSRAKTNQVWVEAGDNQNKRYIYEWAFEDPAFEKFITAAFDRDDANGKKRRRTRLNDIVTAMVLPPAANAGGSNNNNASASNNNNSGTPASNNNSSTPASNNNDSRNPPSNNSSGASNNNNSSTGNANGVGSIDHPQGFIKVYTKAAAPQSWEQVEANPELKAKRDAELPKCQEKLDPEFNVYDLQFEVAALSPDQRRGVIDQLNAAATNTAAPAVTNPFSKEAASKVVKVKLLGDWNHATWDRDAAVKAKLHPLCVTARYLYQRAFEKLKKEFDDRQAAANANGNNNGNSNSSNNNSTSNNNNSGTASNNNSGPASNNNSSGPASNNNASGPASNNSSGPASNNNSGPASSNNSGGPAASNNSAPSNAAQLAEVERKLQQANILLARADNNVVLRREEFQRAQSAFDNSNVFTRSAAQIRLTSARDAMEQTTYSQGLLRTRVSEYTAERDRLRNQR